MKKTASHSLYFILLLVLLFSLASVNTAHAGIISTKQEIAIGEDAVKYVEKKYKLVDDPALQARVDKIGQSLVAVCGRKDIRYTFKVLDSDDINAFALPGGFVYVFRGLTDKLQTDDELAGILGHEIAHVVKRHSVGQLEKNIGMTILATILLSKTENGLTAEPAILSAISAGYSRSDEAEADRLGFEETLAAGYNPYSMLIGLLKLDTLYPNEKSDLFSDHPSNLKRIEKMKTYLNNLSIPFLIEESGSAARVSANTTHTPLINVSADGLTPSERACLLAGNLYRISQRQDYNPDYYILDSDGANMYIYYDNICIMKLTPDDAAAASADLTPLANEYIGSFKRFFAARHTAAA